ncbi:2-C-methyl-D-erythritol 4-phosphate cytidylyltransferase [Amphibacillus sp. Q70]|uniref:2-C-methyl-D-erythritol 4-phosphate cytidylyltransferase n=1 Tax=Amphibacillus sp. Q70 TaxID=3453416 RepID=UPI003F84BAB6
MVISQGRSNEKMNPYYVIILAAGMGQRMQADCNKPFVMLRNKPVLIHTMTVFDQDPMCEEIVLVIRVKDQTNVEAILAKAAFKTAIKLVYGGRERQDSVYNGLNKIEDHNKLIFIHDGARPFVSQESLDRLNKVASENGAALLAVPAKETIKRKNGCLIETLDRTKLYIAQTPQAFSYHKIMQAHQLARETFFYGTDDASLVERIDESVKLVQGDYHNIKMTTPEDLDLALFILNQRENDRE